jgi:hypothetical protein
VNIFFPPFTVCHVTPFPWSSLISRCLCCIFLSDPNHCPLGDGWHWRHSGVIKDRRLPVTLQSHIWPFLADLHHSNLSGVISAGKHGNLAEKWRKDPLKTLCRALKETCCSSQSGSGNSEA